MEGQPNTEVMPSSKPNDELGFFTKIGRVLFRPTEFWEQISTETGMVVPFWYDVGVSAIFAIGAAIFYPIYNAVISTAIGSFFSAVGEGVPPFILEPQFSFSTYLVILAVSLAVSVIGSFVIAATTHLTLTPWRKRSFADTYRVLVYANTPLKVFGPILFINSLASLYSIILIVMGLMKLNNIKAGPAILGWLGGQFLASIIGFSLLIAVVMGAVTSGVNLEGLPVFSEALENQLEEDYLDEATNANHEVDRAFFDLGNLNKNYVDDWTEDDRMIFETVIARLNEAPQTFSKVEAPERFSKHYSLLLAGLQKYADATADYREGILEKNDEKYFSSIDVIKEGDDLREQARRALFEIGQDEAATGEVKGLYYSREANSR